MVTNFQEEDNGMGKSILLFSTVLFVPYPSQCCITTADAEKTRGSGMNRASYVLVMGAQSNFKCTNGEYFPQGGQNEITEVDI